MLLEQTNVMGTTTRRMDLEDNKNSVTATFLIHHVTLYM